MWKPITIKPGDQSLVGKRIKDQDWEDSDAKMVLMVGNKCVFTRDETGDECIYQLGDWLCFEPNPPKKLLAPALCQDFAGFWYIPEKLFQKKQEAENYSTVFMRVIWPAEKNNAGFYEVSE